MLYVLLLVSLPIKATGCVVLMNRPNRLWHYNYVHFPPLLADKHSTFTTVFHLPIFRKKVCQAWRNWEKGKKL
jgi:hypothetical protein